MSFLLEAMGLLPSPDDLTLKPKGGSAADVKGVYFFFFFWSHVWHTEVLVKD